MTGTQGAAGSLEQTKTAQRFSTTAWAHPIERADLAGRSDREGRPLLPPLSAQDHEQIPRTRRNPWLAWPKRYGGELQPEPSENHPVNRLVDQSADVRRLHRQVVKLRRKISSTRAVSGSWEAPALPSASTLRSLASSTG